MMGQQNRTESLFYYFRLEEHTPADHLLRMIDGHVDFSFVREQLKDFYSPMADSRHSSTTCHPARLRLPASRVGLPMSRSSAIRCTPFSPVQDVHTAFSFHPAFPFQTGSSG